jgi:zinc transport system permease protein
MLEAFEFAFMQRALLAIALISVACGVLGTLIVVNRMTFLAGGVSHLAYGGVGLALWLSLPVLPVMLAFTLAGALTMGWISQHKKHRTDTIIGVLWASGMAFGVLLMDLTPGYQGDLMSYLFGSILAIPASDLWWMLGIDGLIVGSVLIAYRPLLGYSFDAEFAQVSGVPTRTVHLLLLGLLACAIVLLIRLVGIILVLALLTIPPYLLEDRLTSLSHLMVGSGVLSLLFSLSGLTLSYYADLTTGACIVLIASACFVGKSLLEAR